MATSIQDFKKMLQENKSVVFFFRKKDGSVRRAVGTLNKDVLAKQLLNFTKNGYIPREANNVQRYYDLEKQAWRSFNIDSFIDVER